MIISVGQFKLAKLARLFSFLKMSKQIEQEALKSQGNISVTLSGGSFRKFLVVSVWEDEETMKKFARDGMHKIAMQKSKAMASEIQLLYYEAELVPSIKEAAEILSAHENTRVLTFE